MMLQWGGVRVAASTDATSMEAPRAVEAARRVMVIARETAGRGQAGKFLAALASFGDGLLSGDGGDGGDGGDDEEACEARGDDEEADDDVQLSPY